MALNVVLPDDLELFIREQVAAGEFPDEAELLASAVRRMQLERTFLDDLPADARAEMLKAIDAGMRQSVANDTLALEDVFEEIEADLDKRIKEQQGRP